MTGHEEATCRDSLRSTVIFRQSSPDRYGSPPQRSTHPVPHSRQRSRVSTSRFVETVCSHWCRDALAAMYDGPTLATLPTDNRWVFRTAELAVLSTNDSPVRIHIHGAVKNANIFQLRDGGLPSVELWMWSERDSEAAARLFSSSAEGECHVHVCYTHADMRCVQRM